ncbi:hypothetical protein ABWH89_04940 [Hoeflea alexandrii]|uniref:hypothetical protein n=1 Tax=Hoeflea alexandrii TaxID=288436 RepID=UPI0035CF86E1
MREAARKSDLVDIQVEVIHTTDRAVLVDNGDRRVWLPLAQVEVGPIGLRRGATVTMPEWLAIEKGLV